MIHAKRTRALAALALALCLSLAGCAREPTPAPACQTTVDAVLASQPFEEMTGISGEKLAELLEVDPAALADQAMAMDASRATAECAIALTAADAGALKALEQALRDYRDATLSLYRDYQPSEVPKLERAVLRTHGLQTVLVVCADEAKAQRALDAVWQ